MSFILDRNAFFEIPENMKKFCTILENHNKLIKPIEVFDKIFQMMDEHRQEKISMDGITLYNFEDRLEIDFRWAVHDYITDSIKLGYTKHQLIIDGIIGDYPIFDIREI